MVVRECWDVLVVDDDPDVLAVTRLALKQIHVYGIPLRLHECTSKAEAIKFLRDGADLSDLSLAIIDVVMETEHAGLDVCKYLRDELNDRITPIVVRTGQPGTAPERKVIEQYDISTYLSKAEATQDKLHATVVNAIRNYLQAVVYESALGFASWLSAQSRESIIQGVPVVSETALMKRRDGTLIDNLVFSYCILADPDAIGVGTFKGHEAEARSLRDQLTAKPAKLLNGSGDRVVQAGDHFMVSLARPEGAPAFDLVGVTNFRPMPDFVSRAVALFMQCARNQMELS